MPRKSEPKLSNRVRELREATAGLTQQELANEVGVTRQTIIAMEKGAYTPSLALAIRVARRFGKPTDEVFWLDD